MNATAADTVPDRGRGLSVLWHRQLPSYPDTTARAVYLAITVLATITLYYELYVGGSVSTLVLADLHMSFTFYVVILAFGNLVGAFGSLFAGLADRLGRANLVVVGLLLTGVFTLVHHPGRDQQVGVRHRVLRGRPDRGHLPGRHPGPDPGLLPAGRPGHGHGLLDQRPGAGQPDRRRRGQRHHPGRRARPRFWTHEYHICGVVGLVVVRDRAHRAARAVARGCATSSW